MNEEKFELTNFNKKLNANILTLENEKNQLEQQVQKERENLIQLEKNSRETITNLNETIDNLKAETQKFQKDIESIKNLENLNSLLSTK